MNFGEMFNGFSDATKVAGYAAKAVTHEKGVEYGVGAVAAEVVATHGEEIAQEMETNTHHLEASIPGMSESASEALQRMEDRIAPEGSSFRFFRKMFARALFVGTRVFGFITMSARSAIWPIEDEEEKKKALQRHANMFSFIASGA